MKQCGLRRRQRFQFLSGVSAAFLGLTVTFCAAVAQAQSGDWTIVNYPAKGGSSQLTSQGTNYTALAMANNGFKFLGWAEYPSGPILSTNDPYDFTLATPVLPAYALFAGIAPPTVKITSPAANVRLRQSQVAVTGKTGDIGVVSAVYYAIAASENGPFVWFPATSENGFKTWQAKTLLLPGANVLAAYALDNAGAPSATNYVKFSNKSSEVILPAVVGLAGQASANTGPAWRFSFDDGTFARMSFDLAFPPAVGDYIYTVTGSNTAVLSLTYIAPPQMAGHTDTLKLTFTSANSALYTNSPETGSITFTPIYTVAPASISAKKLTFAVGDSMSLLDGKFSYESPDGSASGTFGNYSWTRFSPEAGVLHQTETDLVNPGATHDFFLIFNSSSAAYLFFVVDMPGSWPSDEEAPITFVSLPAHKAYIAPAAGSGLVVSLKPGGLPAYTLILDDATLACSSANTNVISGAANYTYTRTGANTATLSYRYFSPPLATNTTGELLLLFNSAGGRIYFNTNGFEAGSFSVGHALNLAPPTLAGRTVVLGVGTRAPATLQFQADSLNWILGGQTTVEGYELIHPSPRTLIVAVGGDSWVQLNFSTATGGSLLYTGVSGVLAKGAFSLR